MQVLRYYNTRIANATLIITALLIGISLFLLFAKIGAFPHLNADSSFNKSRADALKHLEFLNGSIAFTQSILFAVWFFRVYANLKIISPEHKRFGTWLITISWFLPFIGFILPWIATADLRKAYNKLLPAYNTFQRSKLIIPVWVIAFLFANTINIVVPLVQKHLDTNLDAASISAIDIISLAACLTGLAFSLSIIRFVNSLEQLYCNFRNTDQDSIFYISASGNT